jgi:hypothetical protein
VNQQQQLLLQGGRAARTTCATGRRSTSKQQALGFRKSVGSLYTAGAHPCQQTYPRYLKQLSSLPAAQLCLPNPAA